MLEAGGVAPGWKLEGLRPAGSWRDCPRPQDFSWKGPGVKHAWLDNKFFLHILCQNFGVQEGPRVKHAWFDYKNFCRASRQKFGLREKAWR